MEFEVSYTLDDEQQFWDELDDIVSAHCDNSHSIDTALRNYLTFTSNYREEYLNSEYDIARCSCKLLDSSLFAAHKDYVRTQIVYALLQEDETNDLHLITSCLLFDGRRNEPTFELMNKEGAFVRLVELIRDNKDDELGLHRMLLELMYEMSRIQRLSLEDLGQIDDSFVMYLFTLIEELSADADDPYHYHVIRVLLVLNEQYMVSTHASPISSSSSHTPPTNRIIKHLSLNPSHKTFGASLLLLLNRESETSLQLLILKLLYLLFTTPPTREYFYTNDLHVLVDVAIRNLLDLPDSAQALRHTYLRVLYPLLVNTQLRHPPHYKSDELRQTLRILRGSEGRARHFEEVDDTTIRLVERCEGVSWLKVNPEEPKNGAGDAEPNGEADSGKDVQTGGEKNGGGVRMTGPPPVPPSRQQTRQQAKNKLLGMGIESARASSLSVLEVARVSERPGVVTGSKREERKVGRKGENGHAKVWLNSKDGGELEIDIELKGPDVVITKPPE